MALNDFRSVFLPYCIEKKKDGTYIILNREYKPVGCFNSNQSPTRVKFKRLTQATLNKIVYKTNSGGMMYLYDDECVPTQSAKNMNEYMERLAILAKLAITETDDEQ